MPLKQAFVYDIKAKKTATISKSITVFFASAQLLFGFNFGFVKQMRNDYKMAAQFLSVTMGLIMSGYLTFACIFSVTWLIYSIQYIMILFILLANSYTLYEFQLDLMNVKTEIHFGPITENIGIITWLYSSFMFVFKFFIGALYNLEVDVGVLFIFQLTLTIPMLALDLIPPADFLVFYHIYAKLKYLKLGFRNGKTSVFEVQDEYKAIMDLSDKITWTTDNLMIVAFVADCFKLISSIWYQLRLYKSGSTTQICLPAVCAELVHAQGDALRVIAHEKMLHENDEKTRNSLAQLAGYVHARPPLPPAWRLLPLGLRLPTTILSICATYLIVVIQFTHLYD